MKGLIADWPTDPVPTCKQCLCVAYVLRLSRLPGTEDGTCTCGHTIERHHGWRTCEGERPKPAAERLAAVETERDDLFAEVRRLRAHAISLDEGWQRRWQLGVDEAKAKQRRVDLLLAMDAVRLVKSPTWVDAGLVSVIAVLDAISQALAPLRPKP